MQAYANANDRREIAQRLIDSLYSNGDRMTSEEIQMTIRDVQHSIHQMIFQGRRPMNHTRRWFETEDGWLEREPVVVLDDEDREVVALPQEEDRVHHIIPQEVVRVRRRRMVEKPKTLAKAALEIDCLEPCAICMEIPKKKDSLTTECGHEFCSGCYKDWFNTPTSNHSCPSCRKICPKVTTYKARAARKIPVAFV